MFDYESLKEKLRLIGYDGTKPTDDKVVEAVLALAVSLDSYNFDEDTKKRVIDLFSNEGREKINNIPNFQEDSWEDFNYGNVGIGHFVRVKKDAYDSKLGEAHNGLVGILGFMSAGRCLVNYIGLSSGKSMRHPMEKLESLKFGVK